MSELRLERDAISYRLVQNLEKDRQKALAQIIEKAKGTMKEYESTFKKQVKAFYISKSFIEQCDKMARFDITSPITWDEKGIESRRNDSKKERNCNVFAVLAAVSKEHVPTKCVLKGPTTEKYALSLEAGVIWHFMFQDCDQRLINEGGDSGGKTDKSEGDKKGYVVYIAISSEEYTSQGSSSRMKKSENTPQKDRGTFMNTPTRTDGGEHHTDTSKPISHEIDSSKTAPVTSTESQRSDYSSEESQRSSSEGPRKLQVIPPQPLRRKSYPLPPRPYIDNPKYDSWRS